ncbi:MAG: hypothetical protein K2O67_01680 [Clostridia bacterium]|nr:hypothetical protein [Clostridia bacterium]
MQDNQPVAISEEEQYKEFKRIKRVDEAKASVAKIECDCTSLYTDKVSLRDLCKSANGLEIGAIVVLPFFVKPCVSFLGKDPKVSVIAAVDYPSGGETTEVKVAAVKRAVKDGVDEVEVFAPVPYLRDGNWTYFKKECKKLKKAAKIRALRIVLDCTMLNEKELLKACNIAADAGVNCLRLNGADGDVVANVKTALKGKCLIKAEKADNAAAFATLCTMGADYVSCLHACDLANYILKEAEKE